jgi:hypothetical protein
MSPATEFSATEFAAPEPAVVSRFEADLLTILQGFLGHVPRSQLLPVLMRSNIRPPGLSKQAIAIVEDTLAKGATLQLARQGWRRERFVRAGSIAAGSVWQRTPPRELGLTFSPQSLTFLIWATETACDNPERPWFPSKDRELTLGDRWLLTIAYGAIRQSEVGILWSHREVWRNEPLCQLLFAADFEHSADAVPLDFSPWLCPAGLAILEAWQGWLAERWAAMERGKAEVTAVEHLQAIAASQERALSAYLAAVDAIGRRDLARFLLIGLAPLLSAAPTPKTWLAQLRLPSARLADRQEAYREGLAVVGRFQQLAAWQAQARATGYFDEGYQAAQLWKSDWEAYNGESLATAARRLLDQTSWH